LQGNKKFLFRSFGEQEVKKKEKRKTNNKIMQQQTKIMKLN
jgi:hypothetical protein